MSAQLLPSAASGKPIDRWLGLGSIVVAIALFLLAKTPALVICSVSAIFLLLLHPMLNFWWIERTRARRAIAVVCLVAMCFLIGRASWPVPAAKIPTAAEIADELERRAAKNPPPRIPDRPLAEKTPEPTARNSGASKAPSPLASVGLLPPARFPNDLDDQRLVEAARKMAADVNRWASDYYAQMRTVDRWQYKGAYNPPTPSPTDEQTKAAWDEHQRLRQMIGERYLLGFDNTFRKDANRFRIELLRRLPDESLSQETLAADAAFSVQTPFTVGWEIERTAKELYRLTNALASQKSLRLTHVPSLMVHAPELLGIPETVSITFATHTQEITYSRLKEGWTAPSVSGGVSPLKIRVDVDKTRLLVDATVYGGAGAPPVEVRNNNLVESNGWDRNSSLRAFEVVNQKLVPVFQMVYDPDNHHQIIIRCILPNLGGVVAVTDHAMIFNPPDPFGSILKRIFRYPSDAYAGDPR
jgi:hypothetical protein